MWPRPSIGTPTPGVYPSLVIITTYLVCLVNAWEKRRSYFKRYSNFTLFTPNYLPLGGGS